MSRIFSATKSIGGLLLLAALVVSCSPSGPAASDSQTNWLRSCQTDDECGGLACLCGVCTSACSDDANCAGLSGASCVAANDPGSVAECSGRLPASAGLCLPRCQEDSCESGQMCVAGVCTPVPVTTAEVVIAPSARHQTLTGFGATVAYAEAEIARHPRSAALSRALFADLGLDILRLRNRYVYGIQGDLTTANELINRATASLGRRPSVFITSWSPPVALKANGALDCSGSPVTCTLTRTPDGAFDYAGFATYWRESLDAYEAVGLVPDYVGLQNNPDWSPGPMETGEACRFLPVEGTTNVLVAGVSTVVSYPGFAEAQAATMAAFSDLPVVPKILAPETSTVPSVADYASALDFSQVDAISHHLYGTDPANPDSVDIAALGELANTYGRPVFQTETQADGLGTAILVHYATVGGGASVYLQASLTGSAAAPAASPRALAGLSPNDFELQDPYFALRHYSLHTDPGWIRVDATSAEQDLLSSAWLSPAEDALTIVLVNSGALKVDARLRLEDFVPQISEVTRTVFPGLERSAELGPLSPEAVVSIPPRSVVTVALYR